MKIFNGFIMAFSLIAALSISHRALASSSLASKLSGKYIPSTGCQLTNVCGKAYPEFSVQMGLPDDPSLDKEFLGVFGKTSPETPWWGDRRAFLKLDEIGEVTNVSGGGDSYNRLFRQTANGFEIFIQPCALGFCHAWKKEAAIALLPNGNLRISLDGDHEEANGQGSCTLIRVKH